MDKFSMDEKTLDLHIFTPEEPKLGPYTYLNINYLPHLASHIMHKISHKEFCSLIEFELQTYLLELAILPQRSKTLRELTSFVIMEMRLSSKFWIHGSEAWNEVQLRLKLLHTLEPNCTQEQVKKSGGKKSLSEILQDAQALRKYLASLDFSKVDYKSEFLKIPEVIALVSEYDQANSQNKQLQAIDSYNEIIQSLVECKQRKYQLKLQQQIDHVKNQPVDPMSRVTYVQNKETRSAKTDQVSYRDKRALLKEQQKQDVDERRTIFVPNQVYSYSKIDLVILPYIYRFIFGDSIEFTPQHLRIQNLVLYLCLSDQENYKQNKQKKNIILDDSAESKTSIKLFQKYLDQSKDKLMTDFDQYCKNQNISLKNYFSSTPASYRKELLLIRNILILSLRFAQQILGIDYKFEDQKIDQLEYEEEEKNDKSNSAYQRWNKADMQNEYYYFNVLAQLELYYDIPFDQYDDILRVYKNYIEIVYTSKKEHFKEYFGILKTNKDGLLGLKSSMEQVNSAIDEYVNYINAPKTQQKRSYIYHSDNREEWKEEQYKQFLEGLHKYFEIVVNNKKIAKFMGDVNPNHVRFIKGQYLRGLKKRAKEKNINRKELLKQDIENFDISIFEKK
ncbi:unnamed protein product (macronuclear) [Paramecium tetraurelia]|uniref:Uncharacterized protein n=1 Tax=Paramecium tetraurelia TaxID=5888 RepID=A0BXG0_PARTE|nr:uncharacterized protein GSPATT00033080001 [Paramecium tetraurelia]CAK63227.1 unnamed protein product [Paramecium tetraurelia]|eukprot:XP_001430625.1 hypothetical protein (macronuclear) [Paramecium tetraurelia strain d4-2]